MAHEPGLTQTGPQTAACFLLVWTAPLKGPGAPFHPERSAAGEAGLGGWKRGGGLGWCPGCPGSPLSFPPARLPPPLPTCRPKTRGADFGSRQGAGGRGRDVGREAGRCLVVMLGPEPGLGQPQAWVWDSGSWCVCGGRGERQSPGLSRCGVRYRCGVGGCMQWAGTALRRMGAAMVTW